MVKQTRIALVVAVVAVLAAWAGDLPAPWKTKTLGDGAKGAASCDNNVVTLNNTGSDLWNTADGAQFAYQPLKGDGEVVAKVTSLGESNEWAKAGVSFRDGLDADAAHVILVVTPEHGVVLQWRDTKGAESGTTDPDTKPAKAPYWVKLVRKGDLFTGFASADGKAWDKIGEQAVKLAAEANVGLVLTSHDEAQESKAVFENVTVKGG